MPQRKPVAPPAPPPRPTIDPEIVRMFKCQTGAMLTAAEGMAKLSTVILQGIRDDNVFMRGEAASKFERAAALIRGEVFTSVPAPEPKPPAPPATPEVIAAPLPALPPVAAAKAEEKRYGEHMASVRAQGGPKKRQIGKSPTLAAGYGDGKSKPIKGDPYAKLAGRRVTSTPKRAKP